eukprot:UN32537
MNKKLNTITNDIHTGHWGLSIMDAYGQNGGYPRTGVECRTSNNIWTLVYPDPAVIPDPSAICAKTGSTYEVRYSGGSVATSNDQKPRTCNDYELMAMGLKGNYTRCVT